MTTYASSFPRHTDDVALRLVGALAMVGMIVVHLIDLPDKQEEAPYMAALFEALIAACALLTPALLLARPPLLRYVWMAAGLLAAATIAGFVLSRTVGLPQLEDHVGRWSEPAGIVSLVVEAALVVATVVALRRRPVGRPVLGESPLGGSPGRSRN